MESHALPFLLADTPTYFIPLWLSPFESQPSEGRALRDWYASDGASCSFAPLGQGAAGGGAAGEGGRRGGKVNFLSDVVVGGVTSE
jgi:hypothetical protein